MRAVHALAPVGRWEVLDDATHRLAIANGRKILERMAKADGWWELGVGVRLIRYTPPGYRKPQVCMEVHCRERTQLDAVTPLSAAERMRLMRRGKPVKPAAGTEDHDAVVAELRGW